MFIGEANWINRCDEQVTSQNSLSGQLSSKYADLMSLALIPLTFLGAAKDSEREHAKMGGRKIEVFGILKISDLMFCEIEFPPY